MKELEKKSMRILLGILSLRFVYSLALMVSEVRNEYVNALEMGGFYLFAIGGSMVLLLKYRRIPKLGLGCLFFMDFFDLLFNLLKYSFLQGLSSWNLLTKSVLLFDGIPFFIFWVILFIFLFTRAESDSGVAEELETESG